MLEHVLVVNIEILSDFVWIIEKWLLNFGSDGKIRQVFFFLGFLRQGFRNCGELHENLTIF
jgi:hypothetical protein